MYYHALLFIWVLGMELRRIWAATSYLPKSPAVTHSCWFWPWNLGDTGIMAIKSIRATATIIIMMTASTY